MATLLALIDSYVFGAVNYEAFRGLFVKDWLSLRHEDVVVGRLVDDVEFECADFDMHDIGEPTLRRNLDGLCRDALSAETGTTPTVGTHTFLTAPRP